MRRTEHAQAAQINRRIGGLEKCFHGRVYLCRINRRIGGLEKSWNCELFPRDINRRIGGLESVVA